MYPRLRQSFVFLTLFLALSVSAYAQTFGRVMIIAKTPDGEPIEGVKVTATHSSMNTAIEKTTNKKGKATISVVDATKTYTFRFEYQEMNPLEVDIKPVVGSSITREITLDPNATGEAAAAAVEGVTEERRFTPAQKAYNSGIEALRAGDRDAAKAFIREALDKDDKLAPAHSAMAGLYLEEQNYTAALEAARRYQELDPEAPRGFRLIYEAQRGLGNQEEAEAALQAMAQLDKSGDAAAMVYNEGVEALKVGDRRSARARFEEALSIQPDLTAALSGLAIVQIEEKDYAAAAATAERLLVLEPENATALRVSYDAYKNLGQKEKENQAFEALAKVDPRALGEQLYNLGAKFFENGELDQAIDHFERAIQADPTRAKAHYQLALCYVNKEKNALAKEHLVKFVELAPEDPDVPAAKEMISFLE